MSPINPLLIFLVFLSSAFFACVLISAARRKNRQSQKLGALLCLLFGGIFLYQTFQQILKISLYLNGSDRAVIVSFPGICRDDATAEITGDGKCFYPRVGIQPDAFDNDRLILVTGSGQQWLINSTDVVFAD